MDTVFEQLTFVTEQPKQSDRVNVLRFRERLLSEHGFDSFILFENTYYGHKGLCYQVST